MPDYYWKAVVAICPDQSIRLVKVRAHTYDDSLAPVYVGNVPARVTVKGQKITGWIDGLEIAEKGCGYRFHNHNATPWPNTATGGES